MHKRRDWVTKKSDDNISIMNLLEFDFQTCGNRKL